MKFRNTLNNLFGAKSLSQWNKQDNDQLQKQIAPRLRQLAVDHLAKSNLTVAKGFRAEYQNIGAGAYQSFLKRQAQNGAWGTDIEAAALGEALGCNVVVSSVRNGEQRKPFCLYRAGEESPSVHLHNVNNTHWYIDGKDTLGDGNCLYNAFTQALADHAIAAQKRENYFAKTEVKEQTRILAAIKQQMTPEDLAKSYDAEEERISKLSAKEQKQIADDHALALKLAQADMPQTKAGLFGQRTATSRARPGFSEGFDCCFVK